jgi:hypothetical protein
MSIKAQSWHKPIVCILILLFFSALFLLLLSANVQKNLDHDEHQFIAGGVLVSRELELPYVDYAYFHMPNLAFLYAGLFSVTDHLLLSARIFSTVCAWLTLVLVSYLAFDMFRRLRLPLRLLVAAGSVVLLVTNPVFIYTSGKSWNHDLSLLLALLAFVCHVKGAGGGERRKRWAFLSGLFVGLATGTRLSFAPLILPFLGAFLLYPNRTRHQKWFVLPLLFGLGVLLGLLPSLVLFAMAPRQFLFGNLEYARYNTLYRQEAGFVAGDVSNIAMTFGGKLKYLARYVISTPGTLLLLLAFLFFVLSLNITRIWRRPRRYFDITFTLALIPFLLLGSFAPTPAFFQYFYAPIPFLWLGVLYGVASFQEQADRIRWSFVLLACVIVIAGAYGLKGYENRGNLFEPGEWLAVQVHQAGLEIGSEAGTAQVLTLAPLFPLEGGSRIYEEFATGSFGWRVAPLVPGDDRRAVGLVNADDLTGFLSAQPPAAIWARRQTLPWVGRPDTRATALLLQPNQP